MYKGIGADRCKLMCISMAQVSSYKKLLQTAHNGSARRRDQDIQQFGAQLQILYKTRGRPGPCGGPKFANQNPLEGSPAMPNCRDHKMHQNASKMQNSKDRYHYPKHHCVQWEPASGDHYVTFALAQRSLCPVGTGVKKSLSHILTIQEVIGSSGHLRSEIIEYSLVLRLHCVLQVTLGRSHWNRMRL